MALGAGRKGLASELVDEFGYLKGEMPTGEYYTKSQTDNKFETKTHAGNTYQKKTLELPLETLMGSKLTVEDSLDAINEIQKTRQPKTLELPISMLSGSKLTVESALQGLNTDKVDNSISDSTSSVTLTGANVVRNYLQKFGKICVCTLTLTNVIVDNDGAIGTVPEGFRPVVSTDLIDGNNGKTCYLTPQGGLYSRNVVNNDVLRLVGTWITA